MSGEERGIGHPFTVTAAKACALARRAGPMLAATLCTGPAAGRRSGSTALVQQRPPDRRRPRNASEDQGHRGLCRTIANPAGGGGTDLVTGFAISGCKIQNQSSSACPKPGKVQVTGQQLPWGSELVVHFPPKVTDEILPSNLARRDLTVKCTSAFGESSSSGGFTATVGESVLEFGEGQAFVGAERLARLKRARITAG
jgi:hypothetical protein